MKDGVSVFLSNVWKTFSSSKGPVKALQGVDLEVPRGEIFGFLGPNGAGKTTMLRIITTLLPCDEGEVIVAGMDALKNPHEVRKRIGYVSQKGGVDRHATGRENLLLQGHLYNMSPQEIEKQADSLIAIFALEECIDRIVETYSGGQRRRLDIALGMMHKPEILFLDEPTNGLDPQNRGHLWEKIRRLKSEGITIFLTSHYLDEVDALADSLAIMDHGKIVARGTPTALKKEISGDVVTLGLNKELHENARIIFESEPSWVREVISQETHLQLHVEKGESALPQILKLLDQAKIQYETVGVSVPSLNDVFLKKTGRSLRDGESS